MNYIPGLLGLAFGVLALWAWHRWKGGIGPFEIVWWGWRQWGWKLWRPRPLDPWGSIYGWTARVGPVELRKWRQR